MMNKVFILARIIFGLSVVQKLLRAGIYVN